MADRARIGRFNSIDRFEAELDVNDGQTYAFLRDSLRFVPPAANQIAASQERRWGGSHVVGEVHDNGVIEAEWYVTGVDKDGALANTEALLRTLTDTGPGRFLEFRPDGATHSVYYELRGPGQPEILWRWIEWQGTNTTHVKAALPVAPLGVGDSMDIYDDFSADTLTDYAAVPTNHSFSISGGQLLLGAAGLDRLTHVGRGYEHENVQVTMKFTVNGNAGTEIMGVVLKNLDDTNYLSVRYQGTSILRIYLTDNGVDTQMATVNITDMAVGQSFWIRGRIQGNVVTAEHWTTPPTPAGTPANTTTTVLQGANATKWGAGVRAPAGLLNNDTEIAIDELVIEPYTYAGLNLPQTVPLPGIPGSAPALVDLYVTEDPTAAQPWALFAWADSIAPWNQVWNGDFEEDSDSWLGINSGSVARTTAQAKFGTASLQITAASGSNNSGGFVELYGDFKRGVPYTFVGYVRSSTSTAIVSAAFGGGVAGPNVTLSTAWQQITATFVPTTEATEMSVFVRRNTAGVADVFQLDGATIYEGTVVPTSYAQSEGRGGFPPFGVIEAESRDASDSSSFAEATDAAASNDTVMSWTTSGAGEAELSYYIDPSLIAADDFTQGDLRVEVWARVLLQATHVSPKITVNAEPALGTEYGAARYTQEWGAQGKLLTKPSSSSAWRLVRLGTLDFHSESAAPPRWKLRLKAEVSVGSSGAFQVDYIMLAPVRRRMAGLTGKPNDDTYPAFMPSTAEVTRILRADGTGWAQKPNTPPFPAKALGGALPEIGPGNAELLAITANLVPDDPTSDTTAHTHDGVTATVHAKVRPRYFLTRGI